jgi:hypothetical protein
MVTARAGQFCAVAVTPVCNSINKANAAPRENPGINPSP